MDRTLGIFAVLTLILVLITAGMVASANNTFKNSGSPDDALKIAKNFITNDATYQFDGMRNTLQLDVTGTFPEAGKYEITGEFVSAHSGYGDRTNMMVLQVLTTHSVVLIVSNGQVTSAIMDGKYDMIAQKIIQ